MKSIGKESNVLMPLKPPMGADDFSYYLGKVPGLYLGVGGAGKGILHIGNLQLNEKLIEPEIQYLSEFILYLFRNKK